MAVPVLSSCSLKRKLERSPGRKTLSEYESKQILSSYHIPVTREIIVKTQTEAIAAAGEIGYPVVMKVCATDITHKTEKGLVKTDIRNEQEFVDAFDEISAQEPWNKFDGYAKSLNGTADFKLFFSWFKYLEDINNEKYNPIEFRLGLEAETGHSILSIRAGVDLALSSGGGYDLMGRQPLPASEGYNSYGGNTFTEKPSVDH